MSCWKRSSRRKPRRRGTVYVLFLGIAMLVMIIGLSALMVVRVQGRAAEGVNNGAAARFCAQSAVEQSLLAIYGDRSWRDNIAHDTWTAAQPMGAASLAWKLVDEVNGSLTASRSAPVRAYGQGISGESVWIYSVLVQPPLGEPSRDLLVNGDFETGEVSPWWGDGGCELEVADGSEYPHDGAWGALVKNRANSESAPGQTLATVLQNGVTCRAELWVKMKDDPENTRFGLLVVTDSGSDYFEFAEARAETSWTHLSGAVTPTWSGSLIKAIFAVSTAASDQEFYIDDVSVTQGASAAIGPIPGTWRREAQWTVGGLPAVPVEGAKEH